METFADFYRQTMATGTFDRHYSAAALDLARSLNTQADVAADAGNATEAVGLADEAATIRRVVLGQLSDQDRDALAQRLVLLRERAQSVVR